METTVEREQSEPVDFDLGDGVFAETAGDPLDAALLVATAGRDSQSPDGALDAPMPELPGDAA